MKATPERKLQMALSAHTTLRTDTLEIRFQHKAVGTVVLTPGYKTTHVDTDDKLQAWLQAMPHQEACLYADWLKDLTLADADCGCRYADGITGLTLMEACQSCRNEYGSLDY